MRSNNRIGLTIFITILISLFFVYSAVSTALLYAAIYDKEEWKVFKTEFLENGNKKLAKQNLGDVVNGTVKLTMPKEFVNLMGDDYDYTLTTEQKENGFTDVKKNDDGSAEFTIKKDKYDIFIKELQTSTKEAIKETINTISEQGNSAIKTIKYYSNFEQISVYVDKPQFNEMFDTLYINTVGLTACMYRMFDINCDGKCTIKLIDVNTEETYKTITCPDDITE